LCAIPLLNVSVISFIMCISCAEKLCWWYYVLTDPNHHA
jgi:hypothetical protein